MSAYIVADSHINAIVAWAEGRNGSSAVSYYFAPHRRDIRGDAARIASVLYAENVRSVNTRYSESAPAHGFKYSRKAPALTPVQVLKALDGYSYQACETDDWQETEAFAIVAGIRSAAIHALPGYEEAAWEIAA